MPVTFPFALQVRNLRSGGSLNAKVSLAAVIVAAGVLLRVWHYAVFHTIWFDESILLWNVLDRDWLGLLGPLKYQTAAPPIFLFILKGIAVAFGDVPWVWRLLPFACGLGTLLLTLPLAKRVLPAALVPVAVAFVALSDMHVWLGCTIKPYAGDAFVATALLLWFVSNGETSIRRRLWTLAIASPFLICFSYSSVFVLGGILAAMIWETVRERALGAYAGAVLAVGVTCALLYVGPVSAQRTPILVSEWLREFLDWRNPVGVPLWAAEHTATVFQYNYLPTGFVLAALAPIGAIAAWRAGKKELVVALVVPFLLAMAASAVKSYPYGFNRLMHFAAPGGLMLGLLGLAAVFEFLQNRPRIRHGIVFAFLAAMAGPTVYHLVHPWDRPNNSGVAEYVRDKRLPGDVVASDEVGYEYFFRNDLKPLTKAAAEAAPGDRIWVVMDHYTPEVRTNYVTVRLAPAGLEQVAHVEFKQASVYLWVKPK